MKTESPAPRASRGIEDRHFRICCFIQNYFPIIGGAENQAKLLNEELVRRGHTVCVITSRFPGLLHRECVQGIHILRFPFPPLFWRAYGPSAVRFFTRALYLAWCLWRRRRQFDVIHVHLLREPALIAAFVNRFLRKPLLVKVACSGRAGDIAYLHSVNLRPFFRRLLKEIPFAVTVNDESTDELRTQLPTSLKIRLLANGVDPQRYRPAPHVRSCDRVGLVYCGRLAAEKDVGTILRAIALLGPEAAPREMLIAGEGPERASLERLAKELGIGHPIRFLGKVDPEQMYSKADVYVSASRSEGMPNSVLEAMASGLVPICSDISGHRAIIRSGQNGLLFDPGDSSGLALHIHSLVEDPNRLRGLAENARRTIEETFSIRQVARRYEEVYGELLEGNRAPQAQVGKL